MTMLRLTALALALALPVVLAAQPAAGLRAALRGAKGNNSRAGVTP